MRKGLRVPSRCGAYVVSPRPRSAPSPSPLSQGRGERVAQANSPFRLACLLRDTGRLGEEEEACRPSVELTGKPTVQYPQVPSRRPALRAPGGGIEQRQSRGPVVSPVRGS